MKVVLTGGGTGGHIYPAVSVGQAILNQKPDTELLFIGSSHGPEGKIAKDSGFKFVAVPSSPLSGSINLSNIKALTKLFLGVFKAKRMLDHFHPDVVLGTGGYTCAAVLLAQRLRKGKLVIHEQNAVPGRTNLWLSKVADIIFVSFAESASLFQRNPKNRVVYAGMPVRADFKSMQSKTDARSELGLQQHLFTVLVVGGSQGAKRLNNVTVDMWHLLEPENVQILHQTGTRNYDEIARKKQLLHSSDRYHAKGYMDMALALASADLIVSRSGASTLAEISAAGLPSILVPFPFAYADHQRLNADVFRKKRAAITIPDDSLEAAALAQLILKLKNKPGLMEDMARRSSQVFDTNAADLIASEILKLALVAV